MSLRSDLRECLDGSLIRYKGGIGWKANGNWHLLASHTNNTYGDVGHWNTLICEIEDLNPIKVEVIDLIFGDQPEIIEEIRTPEQIAYAAKMAKRGLPYAITGRNM